MNIKSFFFAAAFFLLLVANALKGSNGNNTAEQTKSENAHDFSAPTQQHQNGFPWALEWPNDYNQNTQENHNSDDDGQCYYFHFTRLEKRRWRAIFCLGAKIILLITHICSLFLGFVHITR